MLNKIRTNKLDVIFYRTLAGQEPVKRWLKKLNKQDKVIIAEEIKTVQFGWPIGMPIVRYLENGLKEIRIHLSGKRNITRLIFFIEEKEMILLHGFIKKTEKTPKQEIAIALERKNRFEKQRQML